MSLFTSYWRRHWRWKKMSRFCMVSRFDYLTLTIAFYFLFLDKCLLTYSKTGNIIYVEFLCISIFSACIQWRSVLREPNQVTSNHYTFLPKHRLLKPNLTAVFVGILYVLWLIEQRKRFVWCESYSESYSNPNRSLVVRIYSAIFMNCPMSIKLSLWWTEISPIHVCSRLYSIVVFMFYIYDALCFSSLNIEVVRRYQEFRIACAFYVLILTTFIKAHNGFNSIFF